MSLSGTRGVFSLRQIYNSQRKGTGYPIADVYTQKPSSDVPNFGYWMGGANPPTSGVDRTSWSDDTTTAVPGANLSAEENGGAAGGSGSAAYIAGGSIAADPWARSTIDKLLYSSETISAIPATLSKGYYSNHHFGNVDKGFFIAGQDVDGVTSVTEKLTHSTETISAAPSANSTVSRRRAAAAGNQTYGYLSGGQSSNTSITDKCNLATETTAREPSADLPISLGGIAASANSTQLYVGGGHSGSNGTSVYKLLFSNDTYSAAPGADLAVAQGQNTSTSSSSGGYFTSGFNPASPNGITDIDKINFSNDTRSTLSSKRTVDRFNVGSTSPVTNGAPSTITYPVQNFITGAPVAGPNTGYAVNGREPGAPTPGSYSTVDKIDYSTDTSSVVGNTPTPTDNTAITSNLTNLYSGGGIPTGASSISTIYKITYATDTSAAGTASNLTAARWAAGGLSSPSNGYFTGGGPGVSITDRLVFSSDSVSRIPSADVPLPGVYRGGMAGTPSKGYFIMGSSSEKKTFKLNYSTETYSTLPLSAFPILDTSTIATGNPESAIFSIATTYLQRLIYSTDTAQQIPSAPKPELNWQLMATSSNSDGGYFSGGYYPSITMGKSDTVRFSYASDTLSNLPASNLSASRYSLTGGGARSNGIPQPPAVGSTPQTAVDPNGALPGVGFNFGGWTGLTRQTTSQRTTYSTDSTALVPGANQSNDRYLTTAAGDGTNAYIIGGTPGPSSLTDRCVYSTDTTSLIPAQLTTAKHAAATASSFTVAYVAGGDNGTSVISSIDKMTFSTESFASFPGNLPQTRRFLAATSNGSTAGYFTGGIPGPRSDTLKITYSTESIATLPSTGDLSTPKQHNRGFGSPSNGYFCGGITPGGGPNPGASAIDKLQYSNDTMDRLPASNMSLSRVSMVTTGNATHGYISGGVEVGVNPANTIMEKFTYSNDTIAVAPGADLVAATSYNCGRGPLQMGLPATGPTPAPVLC